MATKQQAADREFDPKYEWQESAANFVLRLHLSGFRKEDFRVQVDGAGRLTVRGQRADGGRNIRFHKVFQLPPASNFDDISGRFDGGVLSITVPKRQAAPPPATTVDDIIRKQATKEEEKAHGTKTTTQVQGKDEAEKAAAEQHKAEEIYRNKAEDDARKKAAVEKIKEEAEAKVKAAADKIKEEVEAKKKAAADKIKEEVEAKKKAAAQKIKEEAEAKRSKPDHQEPKTAPLETKPSQPAADKVIDRDSLLERVRANAQAAAEEAERQKKHNANAYGGWKERVVEELQGLKSSEWAEGVLETVKKNKEVIAAAVTAFSLGLFVASRLSSRN